MYAVSHCFTGFQALFSFDILPICKMTIFIPMRTTYQGLTIVKWNLCEGGTSEWVENLFSTCIRLTQSIQGVKNQLMVTTKSYTRVHQHHG